MIVLKYFLITITAAIIVLALLAMPTQKIVENDEGLLEQYECKFVFGTYCREVGVWKEIKK